MQHIQHKIPNNKEPHGINNPNEIILQQTKNESETSNQHINKHHQMRLPLGELT